MRKFQLIYLILNKCLFFIRNIFLVLFLNSVVFSTIAFGDSRPERIISISPSLTEILFAIGAGAQVVAVDNYSNYPSEAPTTSLSAYEPNMESISGCPRGHFGPFEASWDLLRQIRAGR